jgi:hypothetical protein
VAADALLHPPVYESYGQIVAEALQYRTPVLISDQVGASELDGEKDGLVPHKRPDQWLDSVASFSRDQYEVEHNFAKAKKISL